MSESTAFSFFARLDIWDKVEIIELVNSNDKFSLLLKVSFALGVSFDLFPLFSSIESVSNLIKLSVVFSGFVSKSVLFFNFIVEDTGVVVVELLITLDVTKVTEEGRFTKLIPAFVENMVTGSAVALLLSLLLVDLIASSVLFVFSLLLFVNVSDSALGSLFLLSLLLVLLLSLPIEFLVVVAVLLFDDVGFIGDKTGCGGLLAVFVGAVLGVLLDASPCYIH